MRPSKSWQAHYQFLANGDAHTRCKTHADFFTHWQDFHINSGRQMIINLNPRNVTDPIGHIFPVRTIGHAFLAEPCHGSVSMDCDDNRMSRKDFRGRPQ